MNFLQLKDLLALLDGGVQGVTPPADVLDRAARYAAEVWTGSGLAGEPPPIMEYCALTTAGIRYLCHFNAGWKDCFLIVVCPAKERPEGHLLFDLGGQYRPTTFTDLATGFVGEPTEQRLAESLPALGQGRTPAAILDSGEGSYLQTYRDGPDTYTLECQLVTTAFHFVTAAPVNTEEALRAFRSYAFGKYEWAKEYAWRHLPL